MNNNLRDRLLNFNFKLADNNKQDIYKECKKFNDCIAGGLSTKSKDELYDFATKLDSYKIKLSIDDYKTFNFGDNKIKLDEEQHQIVISNPNNHIRIIAGAGSGKTTTILCRIKYLIDMYTSPNKILVLTFNVDSCQNLKKRIAELFGFEINVNIRTIDSFCSYIKWKYKIDNKYTNSSISELGVDGEEVMLKYGKEISNDFKYVFFDEFQDVNNPQFNILKIFAENGCYLTVIGDDNQNIYQWRGSNNYYIINMDKIIDDNIITYSITTNYRSTQEIVHMANDSITNNKIRLHKTMKAQDKDTDGEISLLIYKTVQQQFEFIINKIKTLVETYNYPLDKFAILSRNNTYLKNAEEILQREKMPYISLLTDKSNYDEKKPSIQPDKITITTIHRSKGLEWNFVFIVGLCDTHFPSHMNNNIKNIEEERRLFYVGITRAKSHLYFVTNSTEIPLSRFIKEIDKHIEIEDKTTKNKLVNKNDLFGIDDKNNVKLKYSVTEIIRLLQGEQLKEMRKQNLIPDNNTEIVELFDEKIDFNDEIKNNFFETDFGEYCDRLLTRYIMTKSNKQNKQNKQNNIRDTDTESIINGIDLTKDEIEIYNKYNIESISLQYSYNIKNIRGHLINLITDINELTIANNICNKLDPQKEVRRSETYPREFMKKLKSAYEIFRDNKKKSDDILKEIYYVSLCRKFCDERRRLIYRDIFDVFIKDFDKIHNRIKEYSELIKNNDILCKVNTGIIYKIGTEYIKICGELDMINITDYMIVDFKCSESDFKVEWLLQVLIYYALLITNDQIKEGDITTVGIFNILNGKLYKISIPNNYNFEGLINYIKNLIEKDMQSNRDHENIDINFLKNYGKYTDNNDNNNILDDSYGFNLLDKNIANNENYISLDVETGTWSTVSDIIQLSYIIYDSSHNEIKRSNKFIKNRIVERRAYDIHGISSEYLLKNGEEYKQVMYDFLVDLNKCKYVIGHNINSDIRHIKSNFEKYGINIKYDPFEDKIIEDTMRMDKQINSRKKFLKLGDLYLDLFKENMKNAHDALADCKATAECYFILIEDMPKLNFKLDIKKIEPKIVKKIVKSGIKEKKSKNKIINETKTINLDDFLEFD
jgi:DNA polymerase III epsilon subunit-like protein